MRDIYEEFGNIFKNHLNDLGYRSSGMILFTEDWNDGKGPQKQIVRIEYDGDSDDFIFEYDFDEGQRCEFIACITDEELIDMWEGIVRCKDCEHFDKDDLAAGKRLCFCYYHGEFRTKDYFCGSAERRKKSNE